MQVTEHTDAGTLSVVTGAAGFVGGALVRRLLADGDAVRAFVMRGDPHAQGLLAEQEREPRLEVVWGDVCDPESVAAAVTGATRVFHTAAVVHAWVPWERYRTVNVQGTANVARAALDADVQRFVAVSTSDVFGIPEDDSILDENSPMRAWGEPYPDTKIEGEQLLWRLHRDRGLPLTVIYPGWVYGPGDRAFFPGLAKAIAGGVMFFTYRGARLPFVYIDHLVDACLLASENPAAIGEGYLIYDSDAGPTMEDLCARIAERIGGKAPTLHVPFTLAHGLARALQFGWRLFRLPGAPPLNSVDVKAFGYQWRLSAAKARTELGWTPGVSIDEGMRRALDALQDGMRPKGSA